MSFIIIIIYTSMIKFESLEQITVDYMPNQVVLSVVLLLCLFDALDYFVIIYFMSFPP